MDRLRQSFDWLPQQMPGVAKLIAEKKRLAGAAHVNECWKRGVIKGEPEWFFACEGALWVGTPTLTDPHVVNFLVEAMKRGAPMLLMRNVEVADGKA